MSRQIFPGIEPQPEFPAQDLTDSNAMIISLMLGNQLHLELSHRVAEDTAWVYRVGHKALERAISHVSFEDSVSRAIDHGVVTYEAICALIDHLPQSRENETMQRNAMIIAHRFTADQVVEYADRARQRFEQVMPRTVEVVYEVSTRYLGPLADYAISGAALARQFDHNAAA